MDSVVLRNLRELVGADHKVETARRGFVQYLNLDNAATTPPFVVVVEKLNEFLETYGSIHRGSGFKSLLSTEIFEEAIPIILGFLGVTADRYALVVTHNTTSAINRLTRMLGLSAQDAIFISEFEHSANDLPWRKGPHIVRIPADDDGQFDVDYFTQALRQENVPGRKIVAISGASNITGAITPIHQIASISHANGALVAVDAAQLVAHREVNLLGNGTDQQIDFISFSGHKMYAPFGGGVLIGRRELLEGLPPDDVGGGNVDFVTADSYDLSRNYFKRATAGTPNVLGLVSMALSCIILKRKIGFPEIMRHEQQILDRLRNRFENMDGIRIYCDLDYDAYKKCSILTFNMDGMNHNLVAARLGHEYGIGVRQGAICQFSYVAKLLGLRPEDIGAARNAVHAGDFDRMYGIVRASFGLGNVPQDADRLADALIEIRDTPDRSKGYFLNRDGEYWPVDKPAADGKKFYNL